MLYVARSPFGRLPNARTNCNTLSFRSLRTRVTAYLKSQERKIDPLQREVHPVSLWTMSEGSREVLATVVLTTVAVPKKMMFWLGSRSIMIANVSQMFASANHEKTKLKMLYCISQLARSYMRLLAAGTYQCLDVEEEHANDAVTRTIQLEEVDDSILYKSSACFPRRRAEGIALTTDAAKEPFSQRRR